MRTTATIAALGCSLLALAGCKQDNNYSAADTATEVIAVPGATSTAVFGVPVPGSTSTAVVGVPVPGPTVTETATPTPTPTAR